MKQGIRGDYKLHLDQASDAVGDICIFLMGVCDELDLDFYNCVEMAWEEVRERDWVNNKEDGKVPSTSTEVGSFTESFTHALAKGEKNFNRGEFIYKPENPQVQELRNKIAREQEQSLDAS